MKKEFAYWEIYSNDAVAGGNILLDFYSQKVFKNCKNLIKL